MMHISKRDAPIAGGSNSSIAGVPEIRMAPLTTTNMDLIARVFKEFKKNACLPGDDRISESFIKAGRVLLGASQANAQAAMTDAARDVLEERVRQTSVEGWTPEHDDEHSNFEMSLAASYYAIHTAAAVLPEPSENAPSKRYNMFQHADAVWPWGIAWRKPTDPRRNLVKAGALILAEIERLDRASNAPTSDLAVQMYMERHMVTEAEAKTFFASSRASASADGPRISESDTVYWIDNRAAIIDAIDKAGFKLMSNNGGWWLAAHAQARDDTGRWTSDYEPTAHEIDIARQAICREFGNNGTDGYHIRILKAVHGAMPPSVLLMSEHQRTIEHAATKLENIGHIFAGDKESRRLATELRSLLETSMGGDKL